jgi:hypothetical protein
MRRVTKGITREQKTAKPITMMTQNGKMFLVGPSELFKYLGMMTNFVEQYLIYGSC